MPNKSPNRDMPEFLNTTIFDGPSVSAGAVAIRLLVAAVLGAVVAGIYRCTRKGAEISSSFPVTLVLLSILIAMVTQVIGDNVARAFSLVGALSIVRFRTVVRDTLQTYKNGAPAATRTRDPLLRRQMLYPTELRAQPENQALASAGLNGPPIVPRNCTPLNEEQKFRSFGYEKLIIKVRPQWRMGADPVPELCFDT